MEQKFKVNQILTAKDTGHIAKIYAVSHDGQPFDLLEISVLLHYKVVTLEQFEQMREQYDIKGELIQSGHTYRMSLQTKEDANQFIEHIAPLYNQILL